MNDILKEICNKKKEQLIKIKSMCSYKSLEKLILNKGNRGFKNLLTMAQIKQSNNIIAEIKKASPSAGLIINNYIPEKIAILYEKSGIGSISILTEKFFFKGEIDHLSLIHKKTNIPILRKDFIIDEYQILESKVYNADAILLIVSILTNQQIIDFIDLANEKGLDCLLETHTEEDLERAIKIGYPIIGINNRNLKNLSIDINNTLKLIEQIPSEFIIVGESGIKTYEDIKSYNNVGIYNFLIGESILISDDIPIKIKELLNS